MEPAKNGIGHAKNEGKNLTDDIVWKEEFMGFIGKNLGNPPGGI